MDPDSIHKCVKNYYGAEKFAGAYQVSACPLTKMPPKFIQDILNQLHPAVVERFYGCGLPVPEYMDGAQVLDLGCGGGRDVYLTSKLVGPKGYVVGVDMTEEMIKIAQSHQQYHAEKFGFNNTKFVIGLMEELDKLDLDSNAFDIVISNCVINLVPLKQRVFEQAYRVLKPGGELYFSDVYSDREVPVDAKKSSLAWNEGFGGALPWDEFVKITSEIGFLGPFICSCANYTTSNEQLNQLIGETKFWARTVRLIKPISGVKSERNNLLYNGRIEHYSESFTWDICNPFPANTSVPVKEETKNAILSSRYAQFFAVV